MKVKVHWKTKDTPKGKVHVSKEMTVKEAQKFYDENLKSTAIKAYLILDGWHSRIYKYLKKEE